MAETNVCSKRHRDEEIRGLQVAEELKRRKSSTSSSPPSYNQILSILEEDEEEQNQDPSSLITILQQEISSEANPVPDHLPDANNNNASTRLAPSNSFQLSSQEEDGDKEKVIRHLLEASDDELGIPNTEDEEIRATADLFGEEINGAGEFEFSVCDNLWEFEDNTANYCTFLQSELFL